MEINFVFHNMQIISNEDIPREGYREKQRALRVDVL